MILHYFMQPSLALFGTNEEGFGQKNVLLGRFREGKWG